MPASFSAPVGQDVSYKIFGTADGVGTATSGDEPTGYKITLNANDTEVPIYIGESQLMANECVDYQKQKVCKTPVARWECTFTPATSPSGIDFIHYTLNWYMLNSQKITTFARMHLVNEVVNPLTEDTPNVTVKESVLTTAKRSGGTGSDVRGDTGCSIRGYLVYNGIKYYTPTFNFTTNYVKKRGSFTLKYYVYENEIDPPVALPTITTASDNTIETDDTIGNVELAGNWQTLIGSTDAESIDVGFTVDSDVYVANASIDNAPPTEVTDTITVPTDANNFTLQVDSWKREQYSETVYNALTET